MNLEIEVDSARGGGAVVTSPGALPSLELQSNTAQRVPEVPSKLFKTSTSFEENESERAGQQLDSLGNTTSEYRHSIASTGRKEGRSSIPKRELTK